MKIELLKELEGAQAQASHPAEDVWLSASAGTGKTHVLAARVMRLLLQPGARPDSLLCLTFTRAGAAEMSERVNGRLASWAMLDDALLGQELYHLGEPNTPEHVAHARTLFARLLDARGGGLRVMTIHAFCQTLLAAFPLEGGLAPGFRAIEGREQATLAANALADLAARAEQEGDTRLLASLSALSLRLGEAEARAFLRRAAPALDALEALAEGIEAQVRRALDVPADFDEAALAAACEDGAIDRAALLELAGMQVGWGTATGLANADRIANWLLGSPEQRAHELKELSYAWATKTNGALQAKGPKDSDYLPLAQRVHAWFIDLNERGERARLAIDIAHALHAARAYARAYADAKRSAGVVDFDDLIGRAAALLKTPGMGAWIAYKLDQAVDHILVDEAQDTNQRQWDIVRALADEFWAGAGARSRTARTLFTVGDTKQAIFGFQGTDPQHYLDAREELMGRAKAAERAITQLSLDRSFRSTPPVLDVVDAVLAELGPDALGCDTTERHESARDGPGRVLLLPAVRTDEDIGAGDDRDAATRPDEETWVPTATRKLASQLARQVRRWLDEPMYLGARGRPLRAGDIMILVRKRSDLAALLVARLQAQGVRVAGVDRLRLASPLAVKDCLAAMRFAVQPDDDLTLASLLVSPICGWTQEQLYELAHVRREGSLWRQLRATRCDDALDVPGMLLAMADFVSPFVFLETMLSGKIAARKNLLRRLGNESGDALDELLGAALQYEREGVATLQGFLDWFDRGTSEVVRDAHGDGDAVRVMTVHAAKGLQAPLVILADAAADPDAGNARDFTWYIAELGLALPLFRPRGVERELSASLGASAKFAADKDRREHWRLLYVAMTRAEEQLVIAGSLGRQQRTVPEHSWHAAVERAMGTIGAAEIELEGWGAGLDYSVRGKAVGAKHGRTATKAIPDAVLERPAWLDELAPAEARPPRPLAPSSLGIDDLGEPPASAAMASAARRGRLIHGLFERLPGVAPASRMDAADRWLRVSAGVVDGDERRALSQSVCEVLSDPRFAALFGADGLAEVPVAGVVQGTVISGTVDRLVVGETTVSIVDYKTQRNVPVDLAAVPPQHIRQMAAYAAVLAQVFPVKTVSAALLYTSGPTLFSLTAADLADEVFTL